MASRFRNYIRNEHTLTTWTRAYQEVWEIMERLYRNNEYLLSKYGRSKQQQRQELLDNLGIHISRERENRIRGGYVKNISVYTLSFIAFYWSISLGELISRDYWAEQEMRIREGGFDGQVVKDTWRVHSKWERKAKAIPDVDVTRRMDEVRKAG